MHGFDIIPTGSIYGVAGVTLNITEGKINMPVAAKAIGIVPGAFIKIFVSRSQIAVIRCNEGDEYARKVSMNGTVSFAQAKQVLSYEDDLRGSVHLEGAFRNDALVCDFDGKITRLY